VGSLTIEEYVEGTARVPSLAVQVAVQLLGRESGRQGQERRAGATCACQPGRAHFS